MYNFVTAIKRDGEAIFELQVGLISQPEIGRTPKFGIMLVHPVEPDSPIPGSIVPLAGRASLMYQS